MTNIPGMIRPEIQMLPQVADRLTFLYLERCVLNRQDSAITVADDRGTVFVPAAAISVIMLGPGTKITHRAMELIGDAGVTVIWVGEQGVRYYASGRPLTHRAALLQRQAELVSNMRMHLNVVRQMYCMRFPNEDVFPTYTSAVEEDGREQEFVQYIKEHQRVECTLEWREYDPEDFYKWRSC